MVVVGTRPEAIKLAPVVLALREDPSFRPLVVATAQHREMLDQVLELFGIVLDVDLDLIQPGQTLTDITVRALSGLTAVLTEHRPDLVMVQGDTTTAFVGALAASYQQIPVIHVEAGLRTGDKASPFPEELNRCLVAQLASLHMAPTATSAGNLLREGIEPDAVLVTGNTVIDALHWTAGREAPYGDTALDDLDDDPRRVILVTAHRRESWGDGMRSIGEALSRLAQRTDVRIVFPIHRNPLVRDAIMPLVAPHPNVTIVEPQAYGAFSRLLRRADVVLTDSGGIQEEAPSLGKPVLVMRDTTERPEAVDAGTVRLVGTDADAIVREVSALLDDPAAYAAMSEAVNPYGDGRATSRILAAMRRWFGEDVAVEPFTWSPKKVGSRQV